MNHFCKPVNFVYIYFKTIILVQKKYTLLTKYFKGFLGVLHWEFVMDIKGCACILNHVKWQNHV